MKPCPFCKSDEVHMTSDAISAFVKCLVCRAIGPIAVNSGARVVSRDGVKEIEKEAVALWDLARRHD